MAHTMLTEDVGAMEQIFTASSLASVFSKLTIRGVEKLAQTWTLQVQHSREYPSCCLNSSKLQLSVWLNAWMNMACRMNIC